MNIFKWWSSSKQSHESVEKKVRESAREVVAAGRVALDEARRSSEVLSSISELSGEKKKSALDFLSELANRGSFDRSKFGDYDRNGLLSCDQMFADELRRLVQEFDSNASTDLEAMSRDELLSAFKSASQKATTIQQVLDRRFPKADVAPQPSAYVAPKKRSEEQIKAAAAARWASHQKNPQSDLTRFQSLYDYQRYCIWQEQN